MSKPQPRARATTAGGLSGGRSTGLRTVSPGICSGGSSSNRAEGRSPPFWSTTVAFDADAAHHREPSRRVSGGRRSGPQAIPHRPRSGHGLLPRTTCSGLYLDAVKWPLAIQGQRRHAHTVVSCLDHADDPLPFYSVNATVQSASTVSRTIMVEGEHVASRTGTGQFRSVACTASIECAGTRYSGGGTFARRSWRRGRYPVKPTLQEDGESTGVAGLLQC